VGADPADPDAWVELLPRTRLLPDTRHRLVLPAGPGVTDVRLDAYPDGGMARLRLWGTLTPAGRSRLGRRWFDTLPDAQAAAVLHDAGLPADALATRPTLDAGPLDPALAKLLDG
jgi:allantoicase